MVIDIYAICLLFMFELCELTLNLIHQEIKQEQQPFMQMVFVIFARKTQTSGSFTLLALFFFFLFFILFLKTE